MGSKASTVSNSSGFWGSIWHSATSAAQEIWEGTIEQVKAVPNLLKTTYQEKDTAGIAANMGKVIATDLVPIIGAEIGYQWLRSYLGAGDIDPSLWIKTADWVLWGIKNTVIFHKNVEAVSRNLILNSKQSSIFDAATSDKRHKVDAAICCKDCSTQRFITGKVRGPAVYLAQQGVILGLSKLVGGYTKVGGFDLIVDGYRAQVIGEMIADYRTANDGLCERHQQEYNRQFWGRILALGVPVVVLKKLLEGLISHYTGVQANAYGHIIETFVSIAMVGIVHHIDMPDPVKKADQALYLPSSFVRGAATELIDIVTPGAKDYIQRKLSEPGKPFDYLRAFDKVVSVYKDPVTQKALVFVLPQMYLNEKAFVNDWVIRDYWSPARDTCILYLKGVEEHEPLLEKKTVRLVEDNTGLVSTLAGWWFGVKPQHLETGDRILRDKTFLELIARLRVGISSMTVEKTEEGFVSKLWKNIVPAVLRGGDYAEPVIIKPLSEAPQPLTPYVYKPSTTTYNATEIVDAIKQGVVEYLKKKDQNQLSLLWNGRDGEMRAYFYRELLDSEEKIEYKLLICMAILNNGKGPTLWSAIDDKLTAYFNGKQMRYPGREDLLDRITKGFYRILACENNAMIQKKFIGIQDEIIDRSNASKLRSEYKGYTTKVYTDIKRVEAELQAKKEAESKVEAEKETARPSI
jgi:hypothetical protein